MTRKSLLSAVIIAIFTIGYASAQTDPGVSTHNYKHPNKAAKAKASRGGIRVATLKTLEGSYKKQSGSTLISTPKYMRRPAALVITRTYETGHNDINPLLSPRNYKTPTSYKVKSNWEVADLITPSDSLFNPTID